MPTSREHRRIRARRAARSRVHACWRPSARAKRCASRSRSTCDANGTTIRGDSLASGCCRCTRVDACVRMDACLLGLRFGLRSAISLGAPVPWPRRTCTWSSWRVTMGGGSSRSTVRHVVCSFERAADVRSSSSSRGRIPRSRIRCIGTRAAAITSSMAETRVPVGPRSREQQPRGMQAQQARVHHARERGAEPVDGRDGITREAKAAREDVLDERVHDGGA